jgi:hypothetical protein
MGETKARLMSTILEAKAIISAEDRTGAAFKAIEAKIAHLSHVSKTVAAVGANVSRASGAVARSTGPGRLAAMRAGVGSITGGLFAGGTALGYGSAIAGGLIAKEVVEQGAKRMHERVRMQISGMTAKEMSAAERESAQLAKSFPPVAQTTIMHSLRNARAIVGSYKDAAEIMDPLLKLRVIAQAARPGQDVGEDFDKLVKGLEIKGATQDLPKFTRYLEGMAKAVNVFGDTLKPTDYYEMFKYGRQSTNTLSEKYMLSTAPTLAQELGGSSAGTAHSAFFRAIVGGRMTKPALARLSDLGLVDQSKVITPKGGHLASAAGAISGSDLAAANPYEWVNKILLPAMKKKGIVDPYKIQEVINSIFSNQVAAQLVGLYATQQSRIEKDQKLWQGAKGLDAAHTIMEKDPIIAWEGLKNSFQNLFAELGASAEHLAGVMHAISMSLNGLLANKKEAESTPGWYQNQKSTKNLHRFLNGMLGIDDDQNYLTDHDPRNEQLYKRRRGELMVAGADDPAALQREIERLRGDNARLSPLAWGTRVGNDNKIQHLSASIERIVKARRDLSSIDEDHGAIAATRGRLAVINGHLTQQDMSKHQPVNPGDFPQSHLQFGGLGWGSYSPAGMPKPLGQPAGVPSGESPEDKLARAFGGKIEAHVLPGQITADLKGEATVNVTVKVDASSELIKAVATAKSAASMGNIRANVGASMPETTPAGRVGPATP